MVRSGHDEEHSSLCVRGFRLCGVGMFGSREQSQWNWRGFDVGIEFVVFGLDDVVIQFQR